MFRLDQLLLQAGALSLTGSGTADTGADRLDGRVQLQVPNLADLSGLAGTPLAGQAGLTLGASGRVQEPALRLDLAGSGITAAKATLASLGGGYDVTLLRAPDGAIAGARIDGAATADGLAVDGRQLGDGRAALEIRAEAPPAGEIKLDRVALTSGLARLDLSGAVDRASLQGQLRLGGGVPDLAAVLALVPQQPGSSLPPLRGALSLDGTARLGDQANRIDADLTLTGQNLQGLPPGAQELLGPSPKLTANATVEQKKAVNVGQLRLEGAALTVSGDPKLGLDRKLGGTVTAELPDLAKLEPVVKQPIAGRLTAKAGLGGTLDAPAVNLDATADALRFGTQTVDRLRLTGTSAGPVQSPAGNLALTATRAGQQLQLAADYALADQRLRLPKVELTGPATRLAGDLQVDLQRLLATGRLAGGVSDLGALSAWTQQKLGGAVNLDLALATPEGRQDATLKADAKGVAGDFGRLEQAGLDATVRDARGKPAVDASATAAGFTRPDLELKQAQLAAKGPLDRVGLTLAASGQQAAQPFDVKAAAEVAALGEDKRVTLSSFGGKLAGQQVQLVTPARLALDKGVLDLDQLDLEVGPAQVQGSLRYGNGSARGEVRLASLPLGLLQSFGAPALKGTAQGSLQLTGTTKAPQASLDLTVSQLQPGGAGKGTPAADLRLSARTQADRLDANLTATGLGSSPLQADAGVPLRFSLEPFAFDLRQDAPLTGKVQGGIDLAKAAALAALDRQQVRGTLTADLRFAGTLSRPQLGGSLQARNGRVDDLTTGMSLRNIALTANASGRRIDLATLSATDRANGKLGGRGSVTFGEGWRPSFDVSLDATRLRVLDSDLGIALVSGNATAQTAGTGAAVRSRLTVNEADIKIPDKTSVSVPTLDVVQKGQPQPPAPEAGPSAYPVSLDVAVDAPERIFVRGRGLELGVGRQRQGRGRGDAARDHRPDQVPPRLRRRAEPALHHPAGHDQPRRRLPAGPVRQPPGQRDDRRHPGHPPAHRPGHRPEAEAHQPAAAAAGRGALPRALRPRGGADLADPGHPARGRRAPAPGRGRGRQRPGRHPARHRPRHAERPGRGDARRDQRQRRQVPDEQRLRAGAAGRAGEHRPGQGRGPAHPQHLGRHQRHRAIPDRREPAVALRLLGAQRPDTGPASDGLPYRLPGRQATFDTPFDINVIGLWTLYVKEVRRFLKVWTQTLMAPVMTTLVFLAIFALAMHRAQASVDGLPFLYFLGPGLIMMTVVQNAFANTSSSIVIAKIQGNIVDYLMPPLSPGELLFGIAIGGVTRGLLVGTTVYVAMLPFVALPLTHPLLVLYYVLSASLMLSLLGILGGLWSDKFDQLAAVTNFVITPLSFLSGTFYSVEALPDTFRWLAYANPFFYMIDGTRYAFTGHADGSVALGVTLLAVVNTALWLWSYELFRRGYKLKA